MLFSSPYCRSSSRVYGDHVTLREQGQQTARHLEIIAGATVKERSEHEYEVKRGVRLCEWQHACCDERLCPSRNRAKVSQDSVQCMEDEKETTITREELAKESATLLGGAVNGLEWSFAY